MGLNSHDRINKSFTYTDGTTQAYIKVNDLSDTCSVQIKPNTAGIGKVQATVSTLASIDDGSAIWKDWLHGYVGMAHQGVVQGATAIRAVRYSGSITLEVRI